MKKNTYCKIAEGYIPHSHVAKVKMGARRQRHTKSEGNIHLLLHIVVYSLQFTV